ncbi:MAG: gliding motility lipoprotein GldB [Bacteroidota bacterium]
MNRFISVIFCFVSFWSCRSTSYNECVEQPDISDLQIDLTIEQLHKKLLNIKSREELKGIIDQEPIIAEFFLQRSNYPSDSIMVDALFKLFSHPGINELEEEVERVFGDLSTLTAELESAFKHLKHYYPQARVPKVKTVATGLLHDMYISDSLVVIGLDYYLGEGAKFRPKNMYNYILRRYAPEYITPSIMLLYGIAPEYNKTDVSDNTVLAEMIAYGKSFYFAKHMMPCTADSVMIWYTAEEMTGVRENKDIIWAHFVENQIVYETDHEVKRKYIEDRPKTYDIGNKAPGRIGTWLGWEIVNAYIQRKPETSMEAIMNITSPQEIFNESKYRP